MEIQNSIFNYATLLKQVKARVALAQKKRFIPLMKKCFLCIGISANFFVKARSR